MRYPTAAADLPDRLWQAVADGDAFAAVDILHKAADGVDEETLLLEVIAPVQEKAGTEWAAGRITVAQEHAATAVNERVVATLAHRRAAPERHAPRPGRVTVGCVDGEWHTFPARLVAEVLRLRGWQVDYLGARIPTPHLVAHMHLTNPDAVLLSASVPTRLPTAHAAVTACQAIGVPVLAGGRAFGADGRHARVLGADRWAADARGAATVLEAGIDRPGPAAIRQVADDLPHLADQEYTMVVQSRPPLVKQTLADLETRFPGMRGYDDAQREHTAQDIAHIVDFLATALYVDDPGIFTAFLAWTADILEARHVPARSVAIGLDSLAAQLREFPRTLGLLRRGSAVVLDRPTRPVPGPHLPA
ncbi:B12-binding domain-containing protein [Streptomyces sp. NPDC088810]|uniref:cobalamin B12-binding domain-containing protein n=1 Tax=Streptomyces sp. NPDC088810 TaxID=3365904 RepID=UPI0037F63AA0